MEMPEQYEWGLAGLPVVEVPELPGLSEHTFTREELAKKLGGDTENAVVQ